MNCPECGGDARVSLNGYYCRECDATWEFIAPENRSEAAR